MLPKCGSLTVEFKSDRKRLSDAELVEALVCLANTESGELCSGVEDDGQPTGLHADHMVLTGLPGLVAARTSPHSARRHAWWKCRPSPWLLHALVVTHGAGILRRAVCTRPLMLVSPTVSVFYF